MTSEQQHLLLAYSVLRDCPPDFLTESMVRALVKHGYRLPAEIASKFKISSAPAEGTKPKTPDAGASDAKEKGSES